MYSRIPAYMQMQEERRRDLLVHIERVRLIDDARRSSDVATTRTTEPRPAFVESYARHLVASLASVAFAVTRN
jgi:hypothetical protein